MAGINDELDKIQSGELVLPYLKNTGDTGTGTYNFTGATVNVAAPAADSNATTKKYVDDADKVNAAAIAAETERATNKENELNTAITTEKERAEAAESSLSGLINQETTDRKAADNAIKQEIANLTNGTTAMPYVKKSGDAMTGALNMGNCKINNVAYPTQHGDAASKGYVDTTISGLTNGTTALPYVKKAGDTMTGTLDMGNQSITHAYGFQLTGDNPKAFVTSNNEAAIASIAEPNNYNVLNVGAPVKDTHAATKKYVDDADAVLNAAIQKEVQDRETAIEGIQTEIDGVTGDLSGYLPLTGGTMTGALNVQAPTEDANAATKAYVDQAVQNATDPELEGRVEALETSQTQQDTEIANLKSGTTALPYIKDTGDTVTGTYDFTGADLTVKAPTANASPATKAYVDSAVQNATDPELAERVTAVENKNTVQDGEIDALQTQMQNLQNGTINLPYLPLIGGALTGAVTTNRQNFGENELVTKKYVDSQVGNTGTHGHMAFVDTVKIAPGASHTFNRESGKDYIIQVYPFMNESNPGDWNIIFNPGSEIGALTFSIPNGVNITDGTGGPVGNTWFRVKTTTSNVTINPGPIGGTSAARGCIVAIYEFVTDGDQPTPPPDPTTSFTTLSGDYSSAISVQGTGSNKASNTEALQSLVDGTKGNLYKFTDHAGTVYWFTCANAVTMTGDTVTVADCDYVVGDGTTVYSGGTLVFKKWQASPADQFTKLNGPYTVDVSGGGEHYFDTETDALNELLKFEANHHYTVTDVVGEITYYLATKDTCTDGQMFSSSGNYVASNKNKLVRYDASITLYPYPYKP